MTGGDRECADPDCDETGDHLHHWEIGDSDPSTLWLCPDHSREAANDLLGLDLA